MRNIFYVVLILLTICMVPVSYAGTFCVKQQTGTVIVFGNGIIGTKKGARESRDKIEGLLKKTLSPTEFSKLQFKLAYNKSYGLLKDLYESAKQKLGSDNTIISFWRWMGDWKIMPSAVQKSAKELSARFDFSTLVAPGDLSKHIALYRTSIMEGNKVLVVSHSQGNFFANAAYEKLFNGDGAISNTGSFGIVAVATPASYVAGGGPYTTLVEDTVIESIALLTTATKGVVSPPLPPNITNILSGADSSNIFGHSFLKEYMVTGSNTVSKITNDIVSMISSLNPPVQKVQSGIITVTLSWGPHTDVDLHTFEPSGSHVYYDNKAGASGYLDLDDTNGNGPEHYYVSCGSIEQGTYKIGVNYFSGVTSPEIAHVQIKAGLSIRNFDIPLEYSDGTYGNNNPIPVANIVVTGDALKGYDFTVDGIVPSINNVSNISLQ